MQIKDDLERIAKGEILSDSWSREVYSVDASNYAIRPSMIVCPQNEYDIQEICRYCFSKNVSITARGAGTGLLGQSLSDSIIIDCTRHMNSITEIGDDYVIIQPGVVKGILDKELKKKGKFLPPDPASSNYCTIGGMIANNSSGVHCLGYGNTITFLEEVKMVYADGTTGFASSSRYDNRIKELGKLLSLHSDQIRNGYPKVTKN